MKLKNSILFWTVIAAAVFLLASLLLDGFGLKFRIWIREPVTSLSAGGLAIGFLQLLLHIPEKKVKIITVLLWTAAVIPLSLWGYVLFGFGHLTETRKTWEETDCIVETEHVMWVYHDRYYEYHNWFVCGSGVIYEEDY